MSYWRSWIIDIRSMQFFLSTLHSISVKIYCWNIFCLCIMCDKICILQQIHYLDRFKSWVKLNMFFINFNITNKSNNFICFKVTLIKYQQIIYHFLLFYCFRISHYFAAVKSKLIVIYKNSIFLFRNSEDVLFLF